jgi:hypothetical protein
MPTQAADGVFVDTNVWVNVAVPTASFVEWPGDIDLAPDAMYDEIKALGVWILE